jgi:hypothetical protein
MQVQNTGLSHHFLGMGLSHHFLVMGIQIGKINIILGKIEKTNIQGKKTQ